MREETSIAQNKVDTLSHDISSSHGKSLSINKDLTQSVLDFIAHQPVNSGPQGLSGGQIGHERARQILENGGNERDIYIKRFQEDNPQYQIQSVNSAQESAKLSSQFESSAIMINADVAHQHAQNTENVLNRGKAEANLDLKKVPESRHKEITESLNKQDNVITRGKEGIDQHYNELRTLEEESQDKNLVRAVAGNTVKTFVKKGSPLASVLPDDFASDPSPAKMRK